MSPHEPHAAVPAPPVLGGSATPQAPSPGPAPAAPAASGTPAASAATGIGTLMTTWLPLSLAVVSWAIGWFAAPALTSRSTVLAALVPTIASLLVRLLVLRQERRHGPGAADVVAVFALHQALLLVTIVLNPFACIYAFMGYLDAPRLLVGRGVMVSVLVTALLCAFGQTGGPDGIRAVPVLFVMLVGVNSLLSLGMMRLDRDREREVAAREAAARELEAATRQNAALQAELVRSARAGGVAAERTRLAREIHDTVAQGLVGVIRQLEAVPREQLEAQALQRIRIAEDAARESLVDARRAVEALAPQQLGDADPVDVLGDLIARWSRAHRVVATFDADEAPRSAPHPHVLLRVTQEALANIARHAEAGAVEISLKATAEQLVLRIADDGRGFDPDAVARGRGHGLPGMRERLSEVGGSLTIASARGAGSELTARLPR